MKNSIKKKISLYFFPKLIFFLHIIEFCKLSCPKDTPFLKQGTCVTYCYEVEVNNDLCILENEIIKHNGLIILIIYQEITIII